MTIIRDQHWTDVPVAGQNRRRRIRNWANYQTPGGLWLETQDVDPVISNGTPPDWEGSYDFKFEKTAGPLQYFAGDTTDPDNTTLVGARSSKTPQFWVNFKALDVVAGTPWETRPGELAIGWRDLWQNCDLIWTAGRHKLDKQIRVKQAPHPLEWRFAMKIPARMTYEITNDRLILKRSSNGQVLLESKIPFATDAEGTDYPVHLEEDSPVGGFPVLRLFVVPAEVQGAVYPVVVDPTVTISGTSGLEDNMIRTVVPNHNYGSWAKNYLIGAYNAPDLRKMLLRIDAAQIPAGYPTEWRWHHWQESRDALDVQTVAGTVSAYSIKDGNDWVEGTRNGSNQSAGGMSSWNKAQNDPGGLDWLGSAGCNTPGTDYDAVALGSFGFDPYNAGPDVERDLVMPDNGVLAAWRDGTRDNNGILIEGGTVSGQSYVFHSPSEASFQPWYVEIDYTLTPPITFSASTLLKRKIQ